MEMAFCKPSSSRGRFINLSFVFLIIVSRLGPNTAARPLGPGELDDRLLVISLRGGVSPPHVCTNVPGNGNGECNLAEMNFADHIPAAGTVHVMSLPRGNGHSELSEMNFGAGSRTEEGGDLLVSLPRGETPPPRTETNVPSRGHGHVNLSEMNFAGQYNSLTANI
ncbi:hypothetical protein H6P81_010747 [Aristolochia fimbriata]|uniref:Uncharacterized protein n=1 Tax=Aristolochia fimbriata TaxID=158543 RepID=A0AAV7ESZ7_ARIFI|nr:hypothetical protein H6P81_010747 [Aristolochia fimbriata]